jgi:Spy/CpxP family protein refolding chaperone
MTRRTLIGVAAVVVGGLATGAAALAAGGAAWAHGGPGPHGWRHGMMKRMVTAAIDDALDAAQATPEQRAAIQAAHGRVTKAVESHWQTRQARMEELLALFEADAPDPARVAELRTRAEAEHRTIADALTQAITEAHDVLTPDQRRAVAAYVRAHRPGHWR